MWGQKESLDRPKFTSFEKLHSMSRSEASAGREDMEWSFGGELVRINRRPVKRPYMGTSYFKQFFLTVSTYIWYSGRK